MYKKMTDLGVYMEANRVSEEWVLVEKQMTTFDGEQLKHRKFQQVSIWYGRTAQMAMVHLGMTSERHLPIPRRPSAVCTGG
jgi:hypothetical protein